MPGEIKETIDATLSNSEVINTKLRDILYGRSDLSGIIHGVVIGLIVGLVLATVILMGFMMWELWKYIKNRPENSDPLYEMEEGSVDSRSERFEGELSREGSEDDLSRGFSDRDSWFSRSEYDDAYFTDKRPRTTGQTPRFNA
ncbi:hypothetical protein NEHOM01_0140 [Nematocida homosporus]|uniref:uncharacterized protein n=1 Tax=Nematocida homosporus TaxID=1912981 RepID=UPI0022207732|nr:uncharacterized protein NEHOM01_0140 [Nematocida homosporus]KAI5184395.1 hypothetical protein NEHOM01_0140 [Nematocida homosporus]